MALRTSVEFVRQLIIHAMCRKFYAGTYIGVQSTPVVEHFQHVALKVTSAGFSG